MLALCQQRLISVPTNYDVLEHILTFLYHYGFLLGRDKETFEKMKEISLYFQFEEWQAQISIDPVVYDPVIFGFQDRMKQLQDYHLNWCF